MELSLAVTVTVPVGVRVEPVEESTTLTFTVTGWFTVAELGLTEVIVVVLPASCAPVDCVTCCA